MLGGITITDARARALDLSEPYLSADQGVIVRKGTVVNSVASAAALRWAVALRNPTGLEVIRNRVKPSAEPTMVVNDAEGIRLLAEGRIDALMLETPDALVVAEANPALVVAGQFRTGEQYAVALSLGSPNTALINDVIREMRNDGTVDLLLRAYFGVEPANVPAIPP
jgi:polar amino acid transport system substrate-binding protein